MAQATWRSPGISRNHARCNAPDGFNERSEWQIDRLRHSRHHRHCKHSVGVVGVQFKMDGASLGVEDAASPFSVS
jgi:hypothetical protein